MNRFAVDPKWFVFLCGMDQSEVDIKKKGHIVATIS